MKYVGIACAVSLFLVLCGCVSFEPGDEPAPFTVSGSLGASRASNAPVRAQQGPEKPGVVFEWDSATKPLTRPIVPGSAVGLTGDGINFGAMSSDVAPANGALRIAGGILVIGAGAKSVSGDTDPNTHTGGVFNLSEGLFRLTIDYKDAIIGSGDFYIRICINNNTTSQARSVLGVQSNINHYTSVDGLRNGTPAYRTVSGVIEAAEPGRLMLTFAPVLLYAGNSGNSSLTNAFLTIVCTEKSAITVTGIKLERLE